MLNVFFMCLFSGYISKLKCAIEYTKTLLRLLGYSILSLDCETALPFLSRLALGQELCGFTVKLTMFLEGYTAQPSFWSL